jgi:hypothetical protein
MSFWIPMSIFSHGSRLRARLTASALLVLAVGPRAKAQSTRVADSLLQAGALVRAESLYYAAVRSRPSDPNARFSLGKYVTSRGAPRVGATLFEEAIRFGGDKPPIERELAPIYLATGDFHSLAALGSVPQAERDRAKYLESHETRTIASDSIVIVPFHVSADSGSVGRVSMRVNGKTFEAVVSSHAHGIVISDGAAASLHLHVFAGGSNERGSGVLAVADTLAIGTLSIRNAAVSVGRVEGKEPVAIGLDALAKFMPTFEPTSSRVVLRVGSVVPPGIPGERYASLLNIDGLRVLEDGSWVSIGKASVAQMLREHRWTMDSRRGQIVVER